MTLDADLRTLRHALLPLGIAASILAGCGGGSESGSSGAGSG